MSHFDQIINRVLAHERGYVNDPRNPDSETQWGISKRSYLNLKIRALTRADAVEIYRRDFWQPAQGDRLPRAFASQGLDAAVNHNICTARRWLQRAAGVADDGMIRPRTLAAVAVQGPADLVLLFNAERLEFYEKLEPLTPSGAEGRAG